MAIDSMLRILVVVGASWLVACCSGQVANTDGGDAATQLDADADADGGSGDQQGDSELDPLTYCQAEDCAEHGVCVEVAGQPASCVCDEGYHPNWMQCEADAPAPQPCDGMTCSGHGQCTVNQDILSCECDDGYVADGLRCKNQLPPATYQISPMPAEFLSFEDIILLLKTWESEAPDIAQYGEYGRVTDGLNYFAAPGSPYAYLRMGTPGQPKILLYAGIHANEKRGVAGTLWMIGHMLVEYGRDAQVTELFETRDVWWIPVLIPEMHNRRRDFDGISTMGNFPDPEEPDLVSIPPIAAFRRLYEQERFLGSISAHDTSLSGGYYWPNSVILDADEDMAVIVSMVQEMRELSFPDSVPDTYKALSDTGGNDAHWAYWHGALAFLVEFGNGTLEDPRTNPEDIEGHGLQHFSSYMQFVRRAPELQPELFTAQHETSIPW